MKPRASAVFRRFRHRLTGLARQHLDSRLRRNLLEGRTGAEVSRQLCCTESTAFRVLRLIRRRLERQCDADLEQQGRRPGP
jgi:hypothetical protein